MTTLATEAPLAPRMLDRLRRSTKIGIELEARLRACGRRRRRPCLRMVFRIAPAPCALKCESCPEPIWAREVCAQWVGRDGVLRASCPACWRAGRAGGAA